MKSQTEQSHCESAEARRGNLSILPFTFLLFTFLLAAFCPQIAKTDSSILSWDFVGETINSTEDSGYPELTWQASAEGDDEDEVQAVDMTITKCTVKAGKIQAQDSFDVSGTFAESPPDLNDISQIDVNIVSLGDDYLVYEESIDFDASDVVKGKFKYKGLVGAITSLTIDFTNRTFKIKAKIIDLTGLGCPLQLNVTLGNYVLSGAADEDIVNGANKMIPIRLMRTYKNEMRVKSANAKPDTLKVKGEIAVEDVSVDLTIENVVVIWGYQTFTIPAGSFTANKGKFTCSKAGVMEGGLAAATFNFTTCSFTITIKNTEIDVNAGAADFGLVFDGFDVGEDLFEGAIDYAGSYPDSADVTYTRKDNTVATENGLPGQIVVLTNSNASSDTVTELITSNGGTVVAQISNAGLYLAAINPDSLNTFLSAMYQSPIVVDAFPNSVIVGRIYTEGVAGNSVALDAVSNSIVQTIDVSEDIECGTTTHKDAVGAIAGQSGVSVTINDVDVFIPNSPIAGSTWYTINGQLLTLLSNARKNSSPVIINISMGPASDNMNNDYHFYNRVAALLHAAYKQSPGILNNTVILIAGSDTSIDETGSFQQLQNNFPGSPIWGSLYYVESQEGAGGCGIGYASVGTANVLSAPGCDVQIPGTSCRPDGTSFATPAIANLIARAFFSAGETINLSIIAKDLWRYQKNNQGRLPSVTQLVSLAKGGAAIFPESASFPSTGGSDSVTVTAPGTWTAASNNWWITISSGSSGSGNGTVAYMVAANTGANERTGTMTIAGQTFTVTQAGVGVTGTWYGTLNMPGACYAGCEPQTISFSLSLNEDAGMNITGSTSNNRTISSGSRSGNSITVTLSTWFGPRGPYTWEWNGTDTITGSMAYFCYDLYTGAILSEGIETFTVTRY